MIRDKNIKWARQRMFIPVWQFQGIIGDLVSMDDVAPAIAEFSTFGFGCMPFAPNDSVSHIMEFPSCWDITKEIGVRVVWGQISGTATQTADWILLYDQADEGEVLAAPATVLDTIIPLGDVAGATLTWKKSSRGIFAADTFDEAALDGTLAFNLELQADTLADDQARLLGVSFDYYPRLTVGGINLTETSRQ